MISRGNLGSRLQSRLKALAVRSTDTKRFVDTFLVCTVLTILVIRFFLIGLGYPQLGGDGLHIAHLLWGGLLLMLALLLAVISLSQAARFATAIVGGIGFGLLIDEIGKFVTSDNNYFFKPTFALIYVALVLVWLLSRTVLLRTELRPSEKLANAIDLLGEAATRPLTAPERDRAIRLLEEGESAQPFARDLRPVFESMETVPETESVLARASAWIQARYETLIATRTLKAVVGLVFVLLTLVALVSLASLSYDLADEGSLGFIKWAQLSTNAVLVLFTGSGLFALFRRSRLTAYRWFELATLFSIFVVQIFDFADLELWAVLEFVVALLLLVTLRLLIAAEERHGGTALRFSPPQVAAVLQRSG